MGDHETRMLAGMPPEPQTAEGSFTYPQALDKALGSATPPDVTLRLFVRAATDVGFPFNSHVGFALVRHAVDSRLGYLPPGCTPSVSAPALQPEIPLDDLVGALNQVAAFNKVLNQPLFVSASSVALYLGLVSVRQPVRAFLLNAAAGSTGFAFGLLACYEPALAAGGALLTLAGAILSNRLLLPCREIERLDDLLIVCLTNAAQLGQKDGSP